MFYVVHTLKAIKIMKSSICATDKQKDMLFVLVNGDLFAAVCNSVKDIFIFEMSIINSNLAIAQFTALRSRTVFFSRFFKNLTILWLQYIPSREKPFFNSNGTSTDHEAYEVYFSFICKTFSCQ